MCIHTLKNERKWSFAEGTQTGAVESPFLPNTLAGGYTAIQEQMIMDSYVLVIPRLSFACHCNPH